jgi:N-acetylmuramoyl-L-alanine amidase
VEFLLSLLLLSFWGFISTAAENIILYTDTQSRILVVTSVEGERYVALKDLLSTVGPLTEVEKSATVLQVKVGKHSLLFRPNSTLVVVDGILTSMGDPALVMPSGWMVPVDSISRILPRLTDRKVTFRQDGSRAFVTAQPPPRVLFEATKGILSSRIAIQVTQAVPFELKQDGKQLVITLGTQPLESAADKLNYSDDRIKSIVFDDSDSRPKIRITLSSSNFDVKSSTTQEGRIFVAVISPMPQITPPLPSAPAPPSAPPAGTAVPSGGGVKTPEKAQALPSRGILRIVTIDVGHGGLDSGSRAANNGAVEKDLALEIAQRLRSHLQQRLGLQVYLTRDTDADISFDQRASAANTNHSDVFISVHVGFSLDQNWKGTRVYVYSPIKEAVASPQPVAPGAGSPTQPPPEKSPVVHLYFRDWTKANAANFQMNQALAELFESELAPLWSQEPSAPRIAALRPLANVVMPSVMVELGNLNSETDVQQIANPQFQARIATAMTNAIQRFKPVYEAQGGSALVAPKPKGGPEIAPGKQEKPSPR